MNLLQVLSFLDRIIWGPPLLAFLAFTGIYLTWKLRFVQFRYTWYSLKLAFTRHDDDSAGDISHFQALMTSLAATIGIGSIAGVATGMAIGGYGALFWMWVVALFGMATKYAEALLAIKYRVMDERSEMCGGPMYYLKKGLNFRFLAGFFAVAGSFTAFGTGNMVQAHSVAAGMESYFGIDPWISGIGLALITGLALIGGIRSIAKISSYCVPAMATFYIVGTLIIVIVNIQLVPYAFYIIVKDAFVGSAPVGGFVGSSVMLAIQYGASRGVFTNEAGLGSAPIAAAAAKTDTPGRQALVSMSGVFITTFIVCTLTGLVIVTTDALGVIQDGQMLDGSPMIIWAFDSVIPYGGWIVTISLILFAYSTILGWAFYGEKCLEYLLGVKATVFYRIIFSLAIIPGSVLGLQLVWKFADIMNALMAIPNLIGLVGLAGVAAVENNLFVSKIRKEAATKSPSA